MCTTDCALLSFKSCWCCRIKTWIDFSFFSVLLKLIQRLLYIYIYISRPWPVLFDDRLLCTSLDGPTRRRFLKNKRQKRQCVSRSSNKFVNRPLFIGWNDENVGRERAKNFRACLLMDTFIYKADDDDDVKLCSGALFITSRLKGIFIRVRSASFSLVRCESSRPDRTTAKFGRVGQNKNVSKIPAGNIPRKN